MSGTRQTLVLFVYTVFAGFAEVFFRLKKFLKTPMTRQLKPRDFSGDSHDVALALIGATLLVDGARSWKLKPMTGRIRPRTAS